MRGLNNYGGRCLTGATHKPGQPGLKPRHFFRFTKWVIFPNRPKMQQKYVPKMVPPLAPALFPRLCRPCCLTKGLSSQWQCLNRGKKNLLKINWFSESYSLEMLLQANNSRNEFCTFRFIWMPESGCSIKIPLDGLSKDQHSSPYLERIPVRVTNCTSWSNPLT